MLFFYNTQYMLYLILIPIFIVASLYCYLLGNLSSTCSSILLLSSDGGATALTLAVGMGDDDEVTTSAGKKRKHWITRAAKG